jgi:hypothetical protein
VNDLGVIDHFLQVFSLYIDSGFGLLRPEVSYFTAALVVIDLTLAGLFWAMGAHEDVLARVIRKTLYIGIGHDPAQCDDPTFAILMRDAILWAASPAKAKP